MKKQITLFGLLLIGLMCGTFSAWAVQDGIVINEVMFMPATGSEWVELYNASGEPRDLDKVWFFDFSKTGNEWKDLTVAANEIDDDFVPVGGMAPKDFLYVGRRDATFQAISVVLGSNVNTIISSMKAEYWNGSDWQDLFATDGTASAGVTLSQNGDITWTVPLDWGATGVNGVSAYYVRFSVDKTLSSNVDVDVVDFKDGKEIDIAGFDITDVADDTYAIPTALPPVPPGAFVVINFDGLGPGADDYDFSDGVVELHSSILTGNVFTDVEDSVILYSGTPHDESTKKDFVAWGDYPFADKSINTIVAPGSRSRVVGTDESIGLHPEMYSDLVRHWIIYQSEETTQGTENAIPKPILWSPPDGSITINTTLTFGWRDRGLNVKNYHFQLDDDANFGSPVINVYITEQQYMPTPLLIGTYYWRVKTTDNTLKESMWSKIWSLTIVGTPPSPSPQSADLGIAPKQQRKDTRLLCLECNAACQDGTGPHSWDDEHPIRGCAHDNMYCARAAISMIASHFGGTLSQDRISYEGFGFGGPERDFGHGRGMWPHRIGISGIPVVDWALNLPAGTVPQISGKPTFANVKTWINQSRPILVVRLHALVVDGYDDPDGIAGNADDQIHVIDPWTGTETSFFFATYTFHSYYVPPAGAVARSDEAAICQDPDNDGRPRFVTGKWDGKDHNPWGLMTFDEENRFKTDPNDKDSDGDCVQDKVEVWSYVFGKGKIARRPDQDGDGIRAEKDSDTDDGGFADGDEDTNLDGDLDAGETDPFKSDDDSDPILVEYFFQGTSPPVPGIDGKGKSWATLALSTDDKKFRFKSADKILGEIDTQKAIVADMWREIPGNPSRIIFTGTNAGVKFYGNVLLENYLRAVVNVTKNNKRVRYLLKACKP
ncbi:MAG: hypothetical protein JRE64_01140 [Deltaproteobacteria bacterium]|nr:hypothetical protein [Deltaproteobacteria bacterium]